MEMNFPPLEADQLEELKEAFNYNDGDGDGRIDLEEFMQMLEQLDAQVSVAEARVGFTDIDGDRDGAIDFGEFVRWWALA